MSESFSITSEQCKQIEEEYLINDIISFLHKAGQRVGYNKTINEAIEELSPQTRFLKELQEKISKEMYQATYLTKK